MMILILIASTWFTRRESKAGMLAVLVSSFPLELDHF
jgi:hypothetical protein